MSFDDGYEEKETHDHCASCERMNAQHLRLQIMQMALEFQPAESTSTVDDVLAQAQQIANWVMAEPVTIETKERRRG